MHKGDAHRGSRTAFHAAIRKYGADSFSITILGEYSPKKASKEEKKNIVSLSSRVSTGKGYNITWGGDGMLPGDKHPQFGKHLSAETKKKISDIQKGKKNASYRAKGKNHWNRGLVRSEETREKIRKKRALQDMSNRIKTVCKRGHNRTPNNVSPNGTCLLCKKLLRNPKT